MQLEQATAVLRPRRSWEAIDLGFRMALRWFLPLWLIWLATALPVFIVLHLFLSESLTLAILIFWWLKPLYEALLYEWLGKALFNDKLPVHDHLKNYPSIFNKALLGALTLRRFYPSRSFNMCVHQLEGLTGKSSVARLEVLHSTNPNSGWLTMLCVHMEAVLMYSIPTMIYLMIPDSVEIDIDTFFTLTTSSAASWINNISYLVVISLMAPFYIAAGFALYINSRTQLEAWDIEIAFRQMVLDRKTPSAGVSRTVIVILAMLFIGVTTVPDQAMAMGKEIASQSIHEILQHEDFGQKKTVTRWKFKSKEINDNSGPDWNFNGLKLLATLIKYIGWIAIAVIVVWLLMKIAASLDSGFCGFGLHRKSKTKIKSGLRLLVSEEDDDPIPDNPVEKILQLCDQGEVRKAMSLLYRATLLQYVTRLQINIPDSATEGECMSLIRIQRPQPESVYFQQLTRQWQWLAYSSESISPQVIRELGLRWPEFFSQPAMTGNAHE